MLKYLLPIYLFLSLNLSADIVQKLNVTGNDRISEETIKVYGEIVLNEDYSEIEVNNILKNLYETYFFEDIKISLVNGVLNIKVKEYSTINFVDLRGEKSTKIKSKILEQLKLKAKDSFVESRLYDDVDKIKKIYASIGFNFATVEAKIEKFDNKRVNLIYVLEKGKKTNIAKINFIGDKKIKEKRLRDIIVSEEMKFWKFLSKNTFLNVNNTNLDKRLLINYYKSLGYYDVQVLSDSAEISKDDSTTLTYTINAGNRYRVTKISTNVSEVLDKKAFLPLEKTFTKYVGKYYSPFSVKKILDELDLLIANSDLQFIEHSVNELLEDESIELKINIYEGSKKVVEKITIKGNTITDETVVRSELLLDEGDPFNSLKLEQSIAKIKARGIFGNVTKTVKDGSDKNQKVVEILVEEKATGEITAGAGIGTNGGTLAFGVTENNWLGRGVSVSTNIDISKENFKGSLSVNDPNFNYSGNAVGYNISRTTTDKATSGYKNNVTSAGIRTSFEQYKDIYLTPGLDFSFDKLTVNSTASTALKKQKGTYSDLSFSYGIRSDKRDRVYAPRDGYISNFSQKLPVYADSPSIRNNYNFSKYQSFTKGTIGAFKFSAAAITGLSDNDVRLSKRISLSSNQLRGFENGKIGPKDGNDYVGGNYAWNTNFELSLPDLLPESTKTDIGMFLDFGNLWKVDYAKSIDDSNKIRSTAGLNASWTSPVGPMTFVLSQNISKASTDVTETFNFKLGTTF